MKNAKARATNRPGLGCSEVTASGQVLVAVVLRRLRGLSLDGLRVVPKNRVEVLANVARLERRDLGPFHTTEEDSPVEVGIPTVAIGRDRPALPKNINVLRIGHASSLDLVVPQPLGKGHAVERRPLEELDEVLERVDILEANPHNADIHPLTLEAREAVLHEYPPVLLRDGRLGRDAPHLAGEAIADTPHLLRGGVHVRSGQEGLESLLLRSRATDLRIDGLRQSLDCGIGGYGLRRLRLLREQGLGRLATGALLALLRGLLARGLDLDASGEDCLHDGRSIGWTDHVERRPLLRHGDGGSQVRQLGSGRANLLRFHERTSLFGKCVRNLSARHSTEI